jgi:peptidyl-prolyl cis-trans isomerase B (cyclophilin B)
VSSRERQQRAERARLATERAAAARRRRWQWLTSGGSVAGLLLLMGGVFWVVTTQLGGGASGAAGGCAWIGPDLHPAEAGGQGGEYAGPAEALAVRHPTPELMVDVGFPPVDVPRVGTQLMTIDTNLGTVTVELDLSATACTAASFAHLAGAEFFDGTYCHRMFPGVLQCGDPNARDPGYREQEGIGGGGPSYEVPDEFLPTTRDPAYYPAGVVAMANSGEPDTNGSQFFFVYRDLDLDGPHYSLVGRVVAGLEVFERVDEIGHDGTFERDIGGGRPNQDIIIETLRVGEPVLPPSPGPVPSG